MGRRLTLLAAVLLLSAFAVAPAAAQMPPAVPVPQPASQGTMTVAATVQNGTPGEKPASAAKLTLYALTPEGPAYTREALSDAAGRASFGDVPYLQGYRFGVVASIGHSTYYSELVEPATGATEVNVPVTVYATTTDASSLRVAEAYAGVEAAAEGQLQLFNAYILSNSGGRTVEGSVFTLGGRATLIFPLPEGVAQQRPAGRYNNDRRNA